MNLPSQLIKSRLRAYSKYFATHGLCVLLTSWVFTVQADALPVNISGFGTLGGSWFSERDADFVPFVQPNGPGRTREFDLLLDSRVGLQVDYALTEQTSITGQAVSEHNADNSITPYLSLANIRHVFDNGLQVRLGRIQPYIFMASEYRLANFANPWVRPPETLYGLFPLVAGDGGDVSMPWNTSVGIFTLRAGGHVFNFDAGRSNASGTDEIIGRNAFYAGLRWQNGGWQGSFIWNSVSLTYNADVVKEALGKLALFDAGIAKKLEINNVLASMLALGVSYEDSKWLFYLEWGKRFSDTALPTAEGWYVTLGRHFGDFMPYFTLSRRDTLYYQHSSSDPTANYIVSRIFTGQNFNQWNYAFGLSYVLHENVMLKGQVNLIRPDAGSSGPYTNNDPDNYNPSKPSTEALVTFNVDFIF